MLTKEPQQTWVFDRYVNGVLMAEGVEVTRASSLEEAMVIAARLAARGPNGETPVLILCNALDQLAAAKAEVERLRDFVVDFADAKIDALRYSPPHGSSPEDEPDPVVDAETVWAWQADAKDAIKAAALAQQPPASGDDGRG